MRTCYLHTGMIKTGSTAIQRAFRNYQDSNIEYARFGVDHQIVPFVAKFADHPEKFHAFQQPEMTPEKVKERIDFFRKRMEEIVLSKKNIVFSSEGLTYHLNIKELKEMLRFFDENSDKITIIIYVRPASTLVASQMQQLIKQGMSNFILPDPEYRKRILPFMELVGRENIVFRRFDRRDLVNGNILDDFAMQVGATKVPKIDGTPNESLSVEALAKLYLFNREVAPGVKTNWQARARNSLKFGLEGYGTRRFELAPALIEQHLEKYHEEIKWAESVCGFDVTGEIKSVENPITCEEDLLAAVKG